MTQSVLLFPPARAGALRAFLESRGFVPRETENAVFAASGDGLTVTLYRTGKLLVQGKTAAAFAEGSLALLAAGTEVGEAVATSAPKPAAKKKKSPTKKAPVAAGGPEKPLADGLIGTDEAGKGDYFGPLCVAGVVLDAEGEDRLRSMGVRDGKTLADPTVLSLDGIVRAEYPFAVVALDPEEYNGRYAAIRNLNTLLASLHGEVIEALATKTGCSRVLTDQFANAGVMLRELKRRGLRLEFRQNPRAEAETAVAAASIVARAEFLRHLEALGPVAGRRLPKGASSEVDSAAREIFRRGGRDALARVAKMHFKTTDKVTGLFGQ